MQDGMLRVILLRNSKALASLYAIIQSQPSLADSVEAIYICNDFKGSQSFFSNKFETRICDPLVPVIQCCKKLKILELDDLTFNPSATKSVLSQLHSRRLESLRLNAPSDTVMAALMRHPCLRTLQIFGDDINNPSNGNLPFLQELIIKGSGPRFRISNLSSWNIMSVTTLIIDCKRAFIGEAQLEKALNPIATQLLYFSIEAGIIDINIYWITARCTNLETICLSYSQLNRHNREANVEGGTNRTIHGNLKTIGLFGLFEHHADAPELVMFNRTSFPRLSTIRVLHSNLMQLAYRVKHGQVDVVRPLEEWHAHFDRIGIRLEDSSGQRVGSLPPYETAKSQLATLY